MRKDKRRSVYRVLAFILTACLMPVPRAGKAYAESPSTSSEAAHAGLSSSGDAESVGLEERLGELTGIPGNQAAGDAAGNPGNQAVGNTAGIPGNQVGGDAAGIPGNQAGGDADTEMETGSERSRTGITGLWRHLQEFGEAVQDNRLADGDLWRHLTAIGEAVRGGRMQDLDFGQYVEALKEAVQGAWVQSGEFWQYVREPGTFVRDGWIRDNGVWYYFDSAGNMAADTTLEIHGHLYSFDESGAWTEEPGAVQPFADLVPGQFADSVYEHPWAGIRLTLPKNALAWSGDTLSGLSALDYIPSYYDFLAVMPGEMALLMVIQYNHDPTERVLEDDMALFSNFRDTFDFAPSAPEDETVAGYPCKRISCRPFGTMNLDVYLHQEDNKVWYLLVLAPRGQDEAVRRLMDSITPVQ